MVIICDKPYSAVEEKYLELYSQFKGLNLSSFQKWAVKAIADGDNVLVTAHTGSGKTLPAEFAIKHFTKQNKKVIYASPIKALSNQKLYDMRRKFPDISFGILTGDCKDNPEADVLIMTTEILRNTLFNKKIAETDKDKNVPLSFEIDIENELAAVVFDEVHYIGDADRGSVWEQAILLLPPRVQLIMLSATINKPERFAAWIEDEKRKQSLEENEPVKKMYLAPTYERVVPLTHYMWVSNHKNAAKKAKAAGYDKKVEELSGKPIMIANSDGSFIEENYYKVNDLVGYMRKNNVYIRRPFVLNSLVKHLKAQSMLPALCFVFSRKHVELAAKEIQFSLFDDNSTIPSIIAKECQKILMSKLPNYKEYLNLPEYTELIALLEKGIAIHHAGIMSVLREMVELLFEKGYIKLLFATETFAVGINMPTKTVIFAGLTKFNGETMRQLHPHEYTQMAGRAGRRGIDKLGHVIHCNNLFGMPTCLEYKTMLTGQPQMLTSKFKISYGLGLNVFASNSGNANDCKLERFVSKSLLNSDIQKEVSEYVTVGKRLEEKLSIKENELQFCRTPIEKMREYKSMTELARTSSNKTRKQLRRNLSSLEEEHKFLKTDMNRLEAMDKVNDEIAANGRLMSNANGYVSDAISRLIGILTEQGFLTASDDCTNEITKLGVIASQLQEVHPLALAEIYNDTDGFKDLDVPEIAALFSCFTNVSVSDELKSVSPSSSSKRLNGITSNLSRRLDVYQDIEARNKIDTGSCYDIHYDLQQHILDWCKCGDEIACKEAIQRIKKEKGIFLGEFVKSVLKINNVAAEFEKVCEIVDNVSLLEKIRQIPVITLKYVASNQSLYI